MESETSEHITDHQSDQEVEVLAEPPASRVQGTIKVLSPAKLEALAKARIAAAEKKKAVGDITRREKALKEKILEDRIKQLNKLEEAASTKHNYPEIKWIKFDESENAYLDNCGNTYKTMKDIPKDLRDRIKKLKPKAKQLKKVVESSSDESESESESSSSEEEIPVRRKYKKHASKSKLSNEVVREKLKQKILNDNYKVAFASLFPGHINIYE